MCAVVLDRQIEAGFGPKTAIKFGEVELTYDDLHRQVSETAAGLLELGVTAGDRVLFRARNVPELCTVLLATFKVGAVAVLTSTLFRDEEIAYVLENSGATLAVTMSEFVQPLRKLRDQSSLKRIVLLDAEPLDGGETSYLDLRKENARGLPTAETMAVDPALLLYSSGTTGRPKGIQHGHRWAVSVADVIRLQMQYTEEDVVMTPGEFSFMATFGHCLMTPLSSGATCALYAERPNPRSVLEAVARYGVTKFMSVPTFYRTVLASPNIEKGIDFSRVESWVSGGESLGASIVERWQERFGKPLLDMYGISELEVVIGNSPANPVRPGSIGKLLPGIKLGLLDDELREVPTGEPGRAMVHRSDPGLFLEYLGQWEKWRLAHRGEWYDTGDVMHCDEEGYYWYHGRDDDLFKTRGMFVSPQEIESAILKHDGVAEAAVIGIPEERIGNRVCAFVVCAEGIEASDEFAQALIESTRERLADYKVPSEVQFVSSLPKNVVGKIVRRQLREIAESSAASPKQRRRKERSP